MNLSNQLIVSKPSKTNYGDNWNESKQSRFEMYADLKYTITMKLLVNDCYFLCWLITVFVEGLCISENVMNQIARTERK